MAKSSVFLKFFGQKGLSGGLNTSDNPIIVPPNQMVEARNVLIGRTLSRKKRPGLERFNSSSYAGTASYPAIATPATAASSIRGLLQYWRYGSATGTPYNDLFLHQDQQVWSIESRTTPGENRTGALVLPASAVPVYQVFEGVLYWTDSEASGYYKWNGALDSPGDAENATAPVDGFGKYLRAHQGRMIMAGNPLFPFRLYYSAAFDGEDWTTPSGGGSLDLSYDGDPQGITAIFPPFQGRLYVATRKQIYEVTGSTAEDLAVRPVTMGIGCIAHNSAKATPNDILFCSDRGIHSLVRLQVSDQSEVNFLSRDIQSLWVDLISRPLLGQVQAEWDGNTNSYIVTAPSSGQLQSDTTLVYNLEFGTWTVWEGIDARSVAAILISNQQYLAFGREDGEIAFLDNSKIYDLDDTDGYTYTWKSGKIYPDDQIDDQWRFISVTILCSTTRQSVISIESTVDTIDGTQTDSKGVTIGNDADVLGSSFILGQSKLGYGRFIAQKISVDLQGYNYQLGITVSGQSDIEFHGFILEAQNAESYFV